MFRDEGSQFNKERIVEDQRSRRAVVVGMRKIESTRNRSCWDLNKNHARLGRMGGEKREWCLHPRYTANNPWQVQWYGSDCDHLVISDQGRRQIRERWLQALDDFLVCNKSAKWIPM